MAYYWRIPYKDKEVRQQAYVALSLAVESFAVNVWSTARKIVPIDTGSLRNSIRIERSQGTTQAWVKYLVLAGSGNIAESGFRAIARGGGGVGVGLLRAYVKGRKWRDPYYAIYVELGTVRMSAKPYMRPAFNKNKNKFKAVVRKIMGASFRSKYTSGWTKKGI